jgi:glycosyltransferase involved in cell wall biosynthesis
MSSRVIFISGSYRPERCGVADYTRQLAQALPNEEFTPLIVTSRQAATGFGDLGTDPDAGSGLPVLGLAPDWRLPYLPRLTRDLLALRPAIVHIQHAASSYGQRHAFGLFPLLLKAMRPGLPLITTAHEYGGWRLKAPGPAALLPNIVGPWLERKGLADREDLFLLSLSGQIIVTNQYHLDYIREQVPGVANKLRLIPIGPNVPGDGEEEREQTRQRVRAELGLPESVLLLCYFGFIHPVKGLETLLRAFQEVYNEVYNGGTLVHLLIVGGVHSLSLSTQEAEEYYQKLLTLRDELGLTAAVTFTGYVDTARVSAMLRAADLGVLPFNHGISLKSGSLLAMLAHGLPVVGTYSEATSAELVNGETLLLAPPRNERALSEALRQLIASPRQRTRLGKAALALADQYSWRQIAGEHVQLYNNLLHKA